MTTADSTIQHSSNIDHNLNNSSISHASNSSNVQHPKNSMSASVHHLVDKTLSKASKANFSDLTAEFSEQRPFVATHGGGDSGSGSRNSKGFSSGSELSATLAAMVTGAATTLPAAATRHLAETTTAFPVQTVATFIASNKNRATTIIVYPTVSPESIVIPIVSCIVGFPILALIVICCLRRRAKLARERDRRRNYDLQDHAVSLVRFSPIHRLSNYRTSRAVSLRPERSLSHGFTSLELDTVMEERCSDIEQTQTETINAESPMDTSTSYKMSFSS